MPDSGTFIHSAELPEEARADMIRPLDAFYSRAGRPLPPLTTLDGSDMPEPYRRLLVHEDDMTPTLEAFHGARIHIRVLGRRHNAQEYYREVVLLLDESETPVEFGAIHIYLDRFPEEARKLILEERLPLGRILGDYALQHTSRPKGYLRLASDPLINDALALKGAHVLYGRRNTLYDPQGLPLAEIVEILPPVPEAG